MVMSKILTLENYIIEVSEYKSLILSIVMQKFNKKDDVKKFIRAKYFVGVIGGK